MLRGVDGIVRVRVIGVVPVGDGGDVGRVGLILGGVLCFEQPGGDWAGVSG